MPRTQSGMLFRCESNLNQKAQDGGKCFFQFYSDEQADAFQTTPDLEHRVFRRTKPAGQVLRKTAIEQRDSEGLHLLQAQALRRSFDNIVCAPGRQHGDPDAKTPELELCE